jgi:cysteine desulfurase/selenocysteine lyase
MQKDLLTKLDTLATGRNQGLDIEKIRKDFPMANRQLNGRKQIYFDSAATNHKPQVLINRLNDLYSNKYAKTEESHTLSKEMTEAFQETRSKVSKLIRANSPDEIVFTTGATHGINIVANGFGMALLKEGDEIIISTLEHHSNIVPWQMACSISGAKLLVCPLLQDGSLDMESFEKLLSENTKIISLAHSSNVLGTILPVRKICDLAHSHGIPVLIDGAQAAPHMPVDMQELDCDFYVFSAHKMGGPAGVGVLYGKAEWLDKLPPLQGGEGMAEKVTFEETEFAEVPKRFEAGTPAFEEIVALGTLIDYVVALDMEKTSAYEQELLEYTTLELDKIPQVKIFGRASEKEPVISFALEGMDVVELEKYLNDNSITVKAGALSAQPLLKVLGVESLLRLSFCYFNTRQEIDFFILCLHDFIGRKS